jgi:3-phosphoshikimate 1-carboxyvinyltransferase
MTIGMMQQLGAKVTRNGNHIEVQPSPYKPVPYHIEPDYSAASYWYEIAALNGHGYHLPHLPALSLQGDAMIAQYATMWGIKSAFDLQGVTISPTESSLPSQPLRLNLMNEPDLAQTIIMTCALRGQHFCIEGIGNLRIKESNRIDTLIGEAAKLGYRFTQPHPDAIAWQGERCEITQPIIIDTHNDHRIAMAFAPAALCFNEIWIDNPDVVTKSYPSYWSDLEKAGFTITPHTS